MGFSVSGSTAIIFVGAALAFTTIYPAAANGFEQVSDARQASADDLLAQQNTDIAVALTTYNATTDTLTVVVTNTGETSLAVSDTDLLVDNAYTTGSRSVAGDASTDLWLPGENLTVSVSSVTARPDRVRVVSEHGVTDGRAV